MIKKAILFFSLLIAISCNTNDDIISSETNNTHGTGVSCEVSSIEFDEAATRSELNYDASFGFRFVWNSGDQLTVFSKESGNQTLYKLNSGMGEATAFFKGTGFTLSKDKVYLTMSKSIYTAPTKEETGIDFNTNSLTNIQASYAGQKQSKNATDKAATAHLGRYDYMVAAATASEEDAAHFIFDHLGCHVYMCISKLDPSYTYTDIELYEASEDNFRQPNRSINLASGYNEATKAYTPSWNEPDMSGTPARFTLKLGDEGFKVDASGKLNMFMVLPPYDFTGKTLVIHINGKDSEGHSKPYFCTYENKQWKMGKAYRIIKDAYPSTKFNINVQVVQDWQKGNSQSQTRAVGDPGTTESFDLPTHLYAFFINGGHLIQTAEAKEIPNTNWRKDTDGIYTYTGTWSTTTSEGTEANTQLTLDNSAPSEPKVYIVASTSAITWPGVTRGTSGTTEEEILGFTYNYPSSNAQKFMKDLYSTPYSATNFTGSLTGEFKTVRLYHVASKLDINWEASSAISGNVSVNNFQTTGLSYFKPSTGNTGSGTDSESTIITTGSAYNGRTVFYIPQPSSATYNITTGTGKTHDITFTRDEVFSSWFRGLITIK